MAMQTKRKEDGRLSLHAFHGQCGKKGIGDVLKTSRATCRIVPVLFLV